MEGLDAKVRLCGKDLGSRYHELCSGTETNFKAARPGDCYLALIIKDNEVAVKSSRGRNVYSQPGLDYIGGTFLEAGADTTAAAC